MKHITSYITSHSLNEGFFDNIHAKMDLDAFKACMKPYQKKEVWSKVDDEKVKTYLSMLLSQMEVGKVLQYEPGYEVYVKIKKINSNTFDIGGKHQYDLWRATSYLFEDLWEICDTVMDTLKLK